MVAIMETLYVVRKDELYFRMTQFLAKFLLISVALGVVTGIVLEFQFGLNWARLSRYVGDVFAPQLAIESWAAFFLESVFIGVWVFGAKRVSPKLHAFALWMVTLGAMLSAFWILTANAFMQEPAGYVLRNGRIELVDFPAVVFNPQTILEFWHTVFACVTTSAFFVIAVTAYHLLKKTADVEFFRRSIRMAVSLGLAGIVGAVLSGHGMAKHVAFAQPLSGLGFLIFMGFVDTDRLRAKAKGGGGQLALNEGQGREVWRREAKGHLSLATGEIAAP